MLEIPLSARFYLLKSKFQVYLSPGWTYFLPLGVTTTTRYVLQDGTSEQIKTSRSFPRVRRIPFNVQFAAGARYALSDKIKIYAQTGLDGYFRHFGDFPIADSWNWDLRSQVGIEIGLK